jgi:hypothetical protein
LALIDDIETKKEGQFILFAATVTALIATAGLWQPLLNRIVPLPFAKAFIAEPAAGPFFLLCSGILFVVSIPFWLFRRSLLITDEEVCHFPKWGYRGNDYRWHDVSTWGWKTTLESDEISDNVPVTRFYVTLKDGKTIIEPGFCTIDLAMALEKHVGERLDIGPKS